MGVVIISDAPTEKQLEIAKKDYGDFVKVTIDIKRKIAAIGGEWHADGEKELIKMGSQQNDIWGGGINLKTKRITCSALINLRISQENDSQEILDPETKDRFIQVTTELFKKYL